MVPQNDDDGKNRHSEAAARPGVVACLTPAVVHGKKNEVPPAAGPADLLSSVDEESKEKTSMASSAKARVPRPSYRTQVARKQEEQKTAKKRSDAMASGPPSPADPGLRQQQSEQTADEPGPAPPPAVPQITSVGSAAQPPLSNLERGDHYVRPGAVAMPGIGRRDDDDDHDVSSFIYDPAQFEGSEAVAVDAVEAQATSLEAVPRDESSGRDLTKEDGGDAKKGSWKSRRTWIVVGGLVAVVAVAVVVVAIVAGGGGSSSETPAPTARPITVAPTTAPPTAPPIPRTQAPIAPVANPLDAPSTIHLLDFLSVYFVQFGHSFDCADWDLPLEIEFQCIQNNQPQAIEIFGHQAAGANAKHWNIVCETDFSSTLSASKKCTMDNPAAPESLASGESIFMVGCGTPEAGGVALTATTLPMFTRGCTTGATAGVVVGAACFPEGTQTGSNGQAVWDLRLQGPGGCGLAPAFVRLDTTPTPQSAAQVRTLDVCTSKSLCSTVSPCQATVSPFFMEYNNAASECYLSEKKHSALGESEFAWDVATAWALVNQSFYVSDFGSKNHEEVVKINT